MIPLTQKSKKLPGGKQDQEHEVVQGYLNLPKVTRGFKMFMKYYRWLSMHLLELLRHWA